MDDIDLNGEDFMTRVNADLIGKYINLASRNAGFIKKHFDNTMADQLHDPKLYQSFVAAGDSIASCYENRQYNRAMREIMALADRANQYIDQHKPWTLAKDPDQLNNVQAICSQGLNLFRVLTTYLKPVLPELASTVETQLNCEPLQWDSINTPLLNHAIAPFKPLLQRITPEDIEAIMGVPA